MFELVFAAALGADPARHQERFRASRDAEAAGRYEAAISACLEAVQASPDGPRTPSCERRVATLERRRDADGRFSSLEALYDVRHRFRTEEPDVLRAEVRAVYAREGLGQVVRAELEVWLARDALERLDDPAQALPYTESAWLRRDDLAEDVSLQRQVVGLHSVTLARLGRTAEAIRVEMDIRVPTEAPRPTPVERVLHDRSRWAVSLASLGLIAAFAIPGLPAAFVGWRDRPTPVPTGVLALVVALGGAGALATGWADGAGRSVPWILLGAVLVHLVAAGGLHALGDRPWSRRGLRLLAALATVAAAWLAMHATGTLEWVGV